MMNRFTLSVALLLGTNQAIAAISCGPQVQKVADIYGAKSAAMTSIKQGDTSFTLISNKGNLIVSERNGLVFMKHMKGQNRDVEIRLNPKTCSISSISFYEPEVVVTGSECFWFAIESSKLDDDGSEYQNPEQHNTEMLQHIQRWYLKKNKKASATAAESKIFQRIRDNCRNSTVIGSLSKGPSGITAPQEIYFEHRAASGKGL